MVAVVKGGEEARKIMDWVENGLIRTCPYSEGAQEELLEVLSKRVTWSAVTTARLIFLKL